MSVSYYIIWIKRVFQKLTGFEMNYCARVYSLNRIYVTSVGAVDNLLYTYAFRQTSMCALYTYCFLVFLYTSLLQLDALILSPYVSSLMFLM